ncbi:TPA: hypothetical protein ACUOBU_002197, partial [Streptococcus pneumoniae]
ITDITKVKGETVEATDLTGAVTATGKDHVEAVGAVPTDLGKHQITAKLVYGDQSEEAIEIPYTVKPSTPSLVSAVGKKDAGSVTVNGVNSGTTVALYDMTNPANPIELGRTDVPKDG